LSKREGTQTRGKKVERSRDMNSRKKRIAPLANDFTKGKREGVSEGNWGLLRRNDWKKYI